MTKNPDVQPENNVHVYSQTTSTFIRKNEIAANSIETESSVRVASGIGFAGDGSGLDNNVRPRFESDKSASGESASLAIDSSFDLGVATTTWCRCCFRDGIKARRRAWTASANSQKRERVNRCAHNRTHARTHWECIYARIYTPEASGGGGSGGIRSAYKRIGGNGVSELAAS